MNTKQLNFAYKVRHALNENLNNLPTSTTERLASARKIALSVKKTEAFQRRVATRWQLTSSFAGHVESSLSLISRLGLAMPLIALVIGIATIFNAEQQRRINDIAEIDALVLSDELPLSAYTDNGFNAYLARRGE